MTRQGIIGVGMLIALEEDDNHDLAGPPSLWRDKGSGKVTVSCFLSRVLAEVTPELRKIPETDVSHLKLFLAPLQCALPQLAPTEVVWAQHFAGGLAHQCTDTNFKHVRTLSVDVCETDDAAVQEHATRFVIAGIKAIVVARSSHARRSAF